MLVLLMAVLSALTAGQVGMHERPAAPGASRSPTTPTPPLFHQPRRGPVLAPAFARELNLHPRRMQRVWVFFTDKGVRSTADYETRLAARRAELAPRAIDRRMRRANRPNLVDHHDLPVDDALIDGVRACGARVRRASRWLNAASVEADAAQIRALAALPFVRRVHPLSIAVRPRPFVETAIPIAEVNDPAARGIGLSYGASFDQLQQIGVITAHALGYTGSGMVIGVLDTGFRRTHVCFNQISGGTHPVQVIDEYDFVDDDSDTAPQGGDDPSQHNHGTYILGTMGAYHPGVLVGAAYDAAFLLAKTEDITQEVPAEEDQYVAGLEWVEANGADLATSSLGYIDWYDQSDLDGATAVTTLAVNVATASGMVCCTAAGNEGNDLNPAVSHLIAPADALAVITCGAVDSGGFIASFSSDGPTFDGRVKPEVLARGVSTSTVAASSNTSLTQVNGTSLSTPLVAGAATLLLQARPTWSVDRVRRALLHSASDFSANAAPDGLRVRGWGMVNLDAALNYVHADLNADFVADGEDITLFVLAVTGGGGLTAEQLRLADSNADGAIDAADVPVFVNDLLGL